MSEKGLTWFLRIWIAAMVLANAVLALALPDPNAPHAGAGSVSPSTIRLVGAVWWGADMFGALVAVSALFLRDRIRQKSAGESGNTKRSA